MRSEGNRSLKNPVKQAGIDPGTVRLVAQRPKHYATQGPLVIDLYLVFGEISIIMYGMPITKIRKT